MPVDWDAIDAAALGALGEPISYQASSGGDPLEVTALFQAPGAPLQAGGVLFEATGPQFFVRKSELADHPDGAPKHGDEITRENGDVYVVKAVRGDEGLSFVLECYDQADE